VLGPARPAPDSCPAPRPACGIEGMSPRRTEPQTAPPQAVPAQVLAVDGTWACLWIPDTGETTWVDLAQIAHEPL